MIPAVSGCGTYIASVANAELQVHALLPSRLYKKYNINTCVSHHCRICNYPKSSFKSNFKSKDQPEVRLVEWEIPADLECGKLAAYVVYGNLHVVFVFDFSEELPAVIEVDSDGISSLQWIHGAGGNGAYSNSTQLAIFLTWGTHVRVYSLDCTLVQFSIPKPVYNEILPRPDTSHIWTVIASPYHEKNSSLRSSLTDSARLSSSILHFYSDGSTSKLLANLSLSYVPNDTSRFAWSPSGKWLMYFDDSECLVGYTLKIYNLFGVHSKPTGSLTTHGAQATLQYSGGSKDYVANWVSAWGLVGNTEFVAVVSGNASTTIKLKAYAISEASSTKPLSVDIRRGQNWIYKAAGNTTGSYQENNGPITPKGIWGKFECLGDKLLLASDNTVALLRVQIALPLHFEAKLTITNTLPLLKAHILSNQDILLVFADHVAVLTEFGVRVLATSRYKFETVHFNSQDEGVTMTLVEESPSGPIWRQVQYNGAVEAKDDSNAEILKQLDSLEENSKVVKLMRDAQSTEWGKRTKEDITDTFQFNSKRRRSLGLLGK